METLDRELRAGSLPGEIESDTVCLIMGATHALRIDGEITVTLFDGACWVTLEGDRADHTLKGGSALTFRGRGLLVIESLTPFAHLRIRG